MHSNCLIEIGNLILDCDLALIWGHKSNYKNVNPVTPIKVKKKKNRERRGERKRGEREREDQNLPALDWRELSWAVAIV